MDPAPNYALADPATGPLAAFTDALSADPEATRQEEADVTAWQKRIEDARTFDAEARRRYAKDRRYARGDSKSFEVATNLIGSNCDTLVAELYAKDPDVDVLLAEQVDAPRETPPMPPPQPGDPNDPHQVMAYAGLKRQYDESLVAYHSVQLQRRKNADDRKAYCRTMGICISKVWKGARMKRKAKQLVRSGLTIGVGWLKVTWQERTGWDPATEQTINDSKARLDRYNALRAQADDGAPDDAAMAEIQRAHDALLEANPKQTLARGLAIDFVRGDDIQVSTDCPNLLDYVDAPWIAHRVFLPKTDAIARYPRLAKKVDGQMLIPGATTYEQNKPLNLDAQEVGEVAEGVDATSADAYRPQTAGGKGENVCVWEIWDKDSGQVLTLVEGVKRWACDPATPEPMSERFYSFFAFAPIEVDGERHPQSKVTRSYKLQDDYNKTRSAKTEHRRRSIPGTIFNKGKLEPADITRIVSSERNEFVGVDPIDPTTPLGDMFTPKPVNSIDPALYDTSEIRADLESVWGLQDAITGRVQVAKTATEADIQQQGTQTRSGADRDALEDVLGEVAQWTTEIFVAKFTPDDARKYAGPHAFWPEGEGSADAFGLLQLSIKPGSSGKPDTMARRQQWSVEAPAIQAGIKEIGQLRQADPAEIADCLENMVKETIERAGDTIEIEGLIPQGNATQQLTAAPVLPLPGGPAPGPGPQGGMPAGLPGPGSAPPMPDVPPANSLPQEPMNVPA